MNRLLSQRLQGAALLDGVAYLIFAIGFLYFLSTENYAILPAASVAGCYIAHPSARYFSAGRIGRDQLEDYARRKRIAPGDAARWLGGIVEGEGGIRRLPPVSPRHRNETGRCCYLIVIASVEYSERPSVDAIFGIIRNCPRNGLGKNKAVNPDAA